MYENVDAQLLMIGHVINMLLEFAGACELLPEDLGTLPPIRARRVHWKILPPGQHPWERLKGHLDAAMKRYKDNTRRVIYDRQETILSFGPDEQHVGIGGFEDYIAYVFKSHGIVVLESIRRDNAIYIFGRDWQTFSQLTKAEIIDAKVHQLRITHAGDWKARLAVFLAQSEAAE
jgi:hypothetical protein